MLRIREHTLSDLVGTVLMRLPSWMIWSNNCVSVSDSSTTILLINTRPEVPLIHPCPCEVKNSVQHKRSCKIYSFCCQGNYGLCAYITAPTMIPDLVPRQPVLERYSTWLIKLNKYHYSTQWLHSKTRCKSGIFDVNLDPNPTTLLNRHALRHDLDNLIVASPLICIYGNKHLIILFAEKEIFHPCIQCASHAFFPS